MRPEFVIGIVLFVLFVIFRVAGANTQRGAKRRSGTNGGGFSFALTKQTVQLFISEFGYMLVLGWVAFVTAHAFIFPDWWEALWDTDWYFSTAVSAAVVAWAVWATGSSTARRVFAVAIAFAAYGITLIPVGSEVLAAQSEDKYYEFSIPSVDKMSDGDCEYDLLPTLSRRNRYYAEIDFDPERGKLKIAYGDREKKRIKRANNGRVRLTRNSEGDEERWSGKYSASNSTRTYRGDITFTSCRLRNETLVSCEGVLYGSKQGKQEGMCGAARLALVTQ